MDGTDVTPAPLPDWADAMADLHVHASPSLLPRHGEDSATVAAEREQGFSTVVLKAHEGSTVERAAIAGEGVYGGVVLNSPVGGANPDAVEVAARLGGRVVWMPTVSARTHQAGARSPELSVHRGFELRPVDVVDHGRLRPEWYDVLDAVAAHDLLLAGGHLSAEETVVLFTEARDRGVQRLLANHPKMAFLGWNDTAAEELRHLDAHLELGILPDLLSDPEHSSLTLTENYPSSLLVFGGDLGHAHHPTPAVAVAPWLHRLERHVGARAATAIMTTTTRSLLLP
ncbi:DUF6282 family protein [Streptomyces parvulus]|uniref:Amidohydrolase-related domain-containing protein n=1 Tax=Streptomyces parvulus TaxID=146923 RepID=A0A369UWY7_9ACTN|nr:DUF6282 family protein [Streptomyces parvulus]RDD85266.1 hypothetical protein DVZ84_30580 [Streptomyces parvulus]